MDEYNIVPGRSTTKRYRKGQLSDNSDAGQQDIRVSSIPSLNTPGWFINQPGNARNWQSYLDEKFALLADLYTTYEITSESITKTGAPIADFASETIDVRTFVNGGWHLNLSAYIDGAGADLGLFCQYSNDGLTWGEDGLAVATVSSTGNTFWQMSDSQRYSGYMRMYFNCDAHTTITGTLTVIAKR